MQRNFDSGKFVGKIGEDLVREFDNARQATTPELVGDAMEQPVRDRLEQILPRGIAVGSGCVIDTKGNTSRQMDIVLYERDVCPIFCVNNSPETTYYPCEGVITVGEVKSVIGAKEIKDSFEKIRSVKSLERGFQILRGSSNEKGSPNRKYGHNSLMFQHFNPEHSNRGDIFGFVLADRMGVKANTLLDHYRCLVENNQDDTVCPDMVIFLDGNVFSHVVRSRNGSNYVRYGPVRSDRTKPHHLCHSRTTAPFADLVWLICQIFRSRVTAELEVFEKYLIKEDKIKIVGFSAIRGG